MTGRGAAPASEENAFSEADLIRRPRDAPSERRNGDLAAATAALSTNPRHSAEDEQRESRHRTTQSWAAYAMRRPGFVDAAQRNDVES